jgi:signal transduction histidine kinase
MFCTDISSPIYLIFNSDIPGYLYYFHLPASIIALLLGIFIFIKKPELLISKILLYLSITFSAWSFFSLITWSNIDSRIIMFSWSLNGILYALILFFTFRFFYLLLFKNDLSIKLKYLFLTFFLPIILLAPTKYNLTSFDFINCESMENLFYFNYIYVLSLLICIYILVLSFKLYKKNILDRKEIVFESLGVILFLILFFGTGFLGSYTDYYLIDPIGLFGMTIFMAFLTYLIVRFKAFDIKLIGSQALVVGIVILIGSQFFFIESNINKVLTAITLVISVVMGILIIRSVKKEIELREMIELLVGNLERANSNLKHINIDLDKANEKLKELDQLKTEFVGLATHQIRGPLTAIKGYLSMILEGDYGKISKSIEDSLRIIFSSAESLSVVVSDFLNVSRIEQGQMKYNMENCDLGELVIEVIKELKPNTDSRGLELKTDIPIEPFIVHIDKEKIKQVINNLIDNSSKYTKEGGINVSLQKTNSSKILLSIKDTGVGISKDTLPHLFEKFSRAKDAFKTNILGTGLGLYVAKKMMEAHKGRVWAESEGEGKGSQFYVEFEGVK